MSRIVSRLAALLIAGVCSASSQESFDAFSLDLPVDPRSLAMGESFVALPANEAGLMYNPAGLGGLRGASLSFSRRSLDEVAGTDDWNAYSVNATAGTAFGGFAIQYNRKTQVDVYSHHVAIGYGFTIPKGPSLGIAARYFDYRHPGGSSPGIPQSWSSTPTYLFDIGIIYSAPAFHDGGKLRETLSLGIAFQNIGPNWKGNSNAVTEGVSGYPFEIQPPQYFRAGFSYAAVIASSDPGAKAPFAAMITGEFRSLLSAPVQYYIYQTGARYWGIGIECSVFEIVSLRGGAVFLPIDQFEGARDKPGFRYGVGINLPLDNPQGTLPFIIAANFTVMKLYPLALLSFMGGEHSSVSAFSIEVRYTNPL